MDKVKNILLCVLLPMLVVMLLFDRCIEEQVERHVSYRDTIRTTFVDTIPYYTPTPRDSVVVRYITERLPKAERDTFGNDINVVSKTDSADVVIPIEQREYEDSTYHAWISGYKVRLDSIRTYTQRDVVTIRENIKERPKRWHIGLQAGYGVGPRGVQPYIGIGVTYSIISF